jgi:hypothetical protein
MLGKIVAATFTVYTSPIWGGLSVVMLGKLVNRTVYDESGYVHKIHPKECLDPMKYKYSVFESKLGDMSVAPWALAFPPASIYVFGQVLCAYVAFPIHVLTVGTK